MASPEKLKHEADAEKYNIKTSSLSQILEKTWQREVVRIDSRYEELHHIPDQQLPTTTSSAAPFIGVGIAMVLSFTVAVLVLIFHYKNPERSCWKKRRTASSGQTGETGGKLTAVNYNFVRPHMHAAVNNCFVQEGGNGAAWIGQYPWVGVPPDSITVEMTEYGTVDGVHGGHSNFSYTTDDESYGLDSDKSYRVDNDRCYPYYYTGPAFPSRPSDPLPSGVSRKN